MLNIILIYYDKLDQKLCKSQARQNWKRLLLIRANFFVVVTSLETLGPSVEDGQNK